MEVLKMSNWNDDRLDNLDEEMKAGFAKVDERLAQTATRREMNEGFARLEGQIMASRQEMKEGFARVDKRFEIVDERFAQADDRFATLTVALLAGAIVFLAALIGVIGALLA